MERRFRLRRAQDFARLRQEGRTYHSRALLLSVIPNGLPHNRYGFITSKQLGGAVKRNRVRRLMRESIRLLHPQLRPGYDMALVARRTLTEEPFDGVHRILEELCRRAGVVVMEGDRE